MQKAPRRSPQEWKVIISEYINSGLSLRDFGIQQQINYHTLIHWRKKISRSKNLPAQKTDAKSGFVSLHSPIPVAPPKESLRLYFDYNIELELPGNYSVGKLVDLLKGLSC